MQSITKDQNDRYYLFLHEPSEDGAGRHYCRAMNTCVNDGYVYCASCPLNAKTDDDKHGCNYYDISSGYSNSLSPEETQKRMEGLIIAGLSDEFPEYIAGEKGPRIIEEHAIRYAADAHKGTFRKGRPGR